MRPLVSIITPLFNRADIIHETANSIFCQTYSNWEWVIVDDGSTDNSWEIVNEYTVKDERVKVFTRERGPKGACTCRNIAVEKSLGDYLIFLDTDDLLATFCLEQRVKNMNENPECDFVIFPMLLFKSKPDDLKILWNIDNNQDDIQRILIGDPVCQGTGTLWKKESFIKVGLWDESLLLWQDIELHLRSLLLNLKYMKLLSLKPDVFIRISDLSLSRTGYHSIEKWRSRKKVLLNTIRSINAENKLAIYNSGLKFMFLDIFLNGVNSGYLIEANSFLRECSHYEILNNKEISQYNNYILFRKYKLYRVPFLQDVLFNNLTKNYPKNNLNKIPFTKPIDL
jgi:glycosyltransferase involved in cell wall biosynthesis